MNTTLFALPQLAAGTQVRITRREYRKHRPVTRTYSGEVKGCQKGTSGDILQISVYTGQSANHSVRHFNRVTTTALEVMR